MSETTMAQRYRFINPEVVEKDTHNGGNTIMLAAHYTNWEWGATIYKHWFKQQRMVGFYKPLNNKYIEQYGLKSRGQFGTTLVDIGRTAWAFEAFKNEPSGYIFVSDQSTYSDKSHWVKFLNQDTICPHGGDKYAHLYNYPVYFVNIQREKRGFYTLTFSFRFISQFHAVRIISSRFMTHSQSSSFLARDVSAHTFSTSPALLGPMI